MDIRVNIANLEVRFETNADETASINYLANVHPSHLDAGVEEIADEFTTSRLGINSADIDDEDRDDPSFSSGVCPMLVWDSAQAEVETAIREHVSQLKARKRHKPLLGC